MPPDELDEVLRYLKALADRSRLRLLGLLATEEWTVEELATLLNLRAPTVSHHLALLKELDLVTMCAEGTTHHYRLNDPGLRRMKKLLATPESVAVFAREFPNAAWEDKVLRDFFQGGQLKAIPAQEKKRLVILKWVAERFEWGRNYSEQEVNGRLKLFHPDFASLRRYLVAHRFMEREHGVYWRTQREPADGELLDALAAAFAEGRTYSEAEVNALLKERAPDHASAALRRDLLASGMLACERGVYFRPQPADA
jgi:DNA-binding transcriptional ArsR family regulator